MASPTRILFIGNSYTGRNDLPGLLRRLGEEAGHPLVTRAELLNGMALKTHWGSGGARAALEEGWDYVVLQEQSTGPFKQRARMHEFVRQFDVEIRSRGAKTVLYLTWARQDAPDRQGEITEAYESIAREVGAIVVPVGPAWERVLDSRPDLALHDADRSHPAPAGSYLAACVFFVTLFGGSPPPVSLGLKGLDAADAAFLRDVAMQLGRDP